MSLSLWEFRNAPKEFRNNKHRKCHSSQIKSLLFFMDKKIHSSDLYHSKETSLYISLPGSYTVEAAVVLPVFLAFGIFCIFFLRILMVQIGVDNGLQAAAAKSAVSCVSDRETSMAELILLSAKEISENKTPVSFITGGIAGISFGDSDIDGNYINITAKYEVRFPIRIFGDLRWQMESSVSSRKWIGWDPKEGEGDRDFVYVTKEGEVYHERYDCSYLHPSIIAVTTEEVKHCRNDSGSRYVCCRSCGKGAKDCRIYYLTKYGESYHTRLSCIGLKRCIYRRSRESTVGMRACKKCCGVTCDVE